MIYRSIKIFILAVLAAALLPACDRDEEPATRSFYMGFSTLPYGVSNEALNYLYAKLETDADIISHHFDNGVPWVEALNDAPFHPAILEDWDLHKSKTNPDQKVYLSVSPLNFTHDGLASYRGEKDNMALPEPWGSYPFNHVNVRAAYFNYCKRIIDYFEPDYFNMAIEANLLYVMEPDKWSAYLQFHQYVYTQLKFAYPDLPILTSVSGIYLLKDFIENNDHVQQRLAVLQLMDYSDIYAISFYPYLRNHLANPYPDNAFEELFSISEKPLAIAETGYAAESFQADSGPGLVTVESDPLKQQQYIKDLLAACDRRKALFVINFIVRDCSKLLPVDSPVDIDITRRDTGFYDENGNARPVLTTWKKFLSRKHQATNN